LASLRTTAPVLSFSFRFGGWVALEDAPGQRGCLEVLDPHTASAVVVALGPFGVVDHVQERRDRLPDLEAPHAMARCEADEVGIVEGIRIICYVGDHRLGSTGLGCGVCGRRRRLEAEAVGPGAAGDVWRASVDPVDEQPQLGLEQTEPVAWAGVADTRTRCIGISIGKHEIWLTRSGTGDRHGEKNRTLSGLTLGIGVGAGCSDHEKVAVLPEKLALLEQPLPHAARLLGVLFHQQGLRQCHGASELLLQDLERGRADVVRRVERRVRGCHNRR
jgi:hypothetical protein